MKKSERKEREQEAFRCVESSLDRLRRAGQRNEKATALHQKKRVFALANILEPDADIDEPDSSGLHELS